MQLSGDEILHELESGYREPAAEYLNSLDRRQNASRVPSLLPDWRTPCWRQENKLLCTPYFYIAGFRKCATSDLHSKVSLHPHVIRTWRKEEYWLTWRHAYSPLEVHAESFGGVVQNTAQDQPDKFILGSGDPNVVWYHLRNRANEYHIIPPHLLRRINPNAKIIIMVRQPSERLFSDYVYRRYPTNRPGCPDVFHALMTSRITWYMQCLRERGIRECVVNATTMLDDELKYNAAITHSMYVVFLHEWLRVFNRDQILIIRTEDYSENRTATLREVLDFLELDPLDDVIVHDLAHMLSLNRAGFTEGHVVKPVMHNETRTLLDEFFKPFNQALAKLLKDDRFLWH